uniref:Uncharacterized protein n=1 Tax=Acrobeloides nanus TaxID=290746 RepID=A0A914CAK1_9BILA
MEVCRSDSEGTFDTDAVFQCMQEESKHPKNCWANTRKQMCASKPGQFIDVSETFGSRRQNGSRQERDPTARGSSPSVFSKFSDLEIGDESYVQQFMKCVRQCGKQNIDQICYKKLNCAAKKLSPNVMEERMQTCRNQREGQRKRMCDCLISAAAPDLCDKLEETYGGVSGFLG